VGKTFDSTSKPDVSAGESGGATEANRTLFPSLHFWEDPWEPNFDLAKLRASAAKLDQVAKLGDLREWKRPFPRSPVNAEFLKSLIEPLPLRAAVADKLKLDVTLLGAWFVLPAQLRALSMGVPQHIAALQSTAAHARHLYNEISSNALGVEDLINAFAADEAEMDVLNLTVELGTFIEGATRAIERLHLGQPGRKTDSRRNVAIALATHAVEEATENRVQITKGDDWHFTNPPGEFVRDVMKLLNGDSERVLVGAFDKIRRIRKVKQ